MTNDDEMRGLSRVLERATDAIKAGGLTRTVLAQAGRRRARRRAVVGTAAAVVAVVGAASVVVAQRGGDDPAPTLTPTGTASTTSTASQTDSVTIAPAPPPARQAVGPWWDPFTVADAALRNSVLPDPISPPAAAPSVFDQPIAAAALAWPEEGQDLRLLGYDGEWRSVPGTADAVKGTLRDVVGPALSSDGDEVAMSTNDGILVVDIAAGSQQLIPWPGPISHPWDTAPRLQWLPGGDGFLVHHWKAPWLVGMDGTGRRAPYGGSYGLGLAVDPDGPIVRHDFEAHTLETWQDDRIVRKVQFPYWAAGPATRYGRVALVGSGNGLPGHDGPMVLDTSTGELLAYRPIRDPSSVYADNGHLRPQGFLDADTALYLVGPADFRTMEPGEETWHLVAWHIDTGEFERLASGDARMSAIEVATEVVEGG